MSDGATKGIELERDATAPLDPSHVSAVICDMLGCRERATGEVQIGDEYIPLCELHRKSGMDMLTPKWIPLPPHPPNDQAEAQTPRR